jgi:mRNA interferase MazF
MIHRGDIVLIDLDPVRGAEQNKVRPAVVVSNDAANSAATQDGRGVITVVPITSNVQTLYHFQVLVTAQETGLRRDGKVQAEQVRAVTVQRVGRTLGRLPAERLTQLDQALRDHLAL